MLGLELGEQAVVGERAAGEVDRQAQRRRRAAAISSSALRGDPAVDLLDEVEALGDLQERAGRDQVAVVVEHAHQQLVLGDLAGAQVEDRLRVQHEAVVLERVADPLDPVHPRLHARAARGGRRRRRRSGRGRPPWPRTSRGRR